ncbi:AGE family epimerase/isomerase [Tsukamurella soli]|uniref:Mannose or cellobiose epimerase, N-acyl-D-glucosamine 2-epimerase family n=1 Tax=Tsukamurella soli TaxID=644556 RepID=A0ABP8JW72_9ACTN
MTPPMARPLHRTWLNAHALHLLDFGRRTALPDGGAAWLDDLGAPTPDIPVHTLITCRMTHVYSIGALLGVPGARTVARRAMAGLTGTLHDPEYGGWYPARHPDGSADPTKTCYDHAFVLLAASSATLAGVPGADSLLEDAHRILLDRFSDDTAGLCIDTWDETFTTPLAYRGINANMHAVEAMLSAADVTGDRDLIDRALRICRFAADTARSHDWRLPEHYDSHWRPQLDFHRDRPDDQFKPYGATVGHGLEWSRLLLHTEAAAAAQAGPWLLDAARRLFDRAVADGWNTDGHPGFVYTTDWDGRPVVHDRLHWVCAEAVNAAAALFRRTGDERYAQWYETFWDYADQHLIDHEQGSWRHQLSADNAPSHTIWEGKPDLYHAFQSTLVPQLPLYPMLATAVASGSLAGTANSSANHP